jgi:hypothetical protein
MSKAIQLSVSEPCHENWDKMNPVNQGRFCGSCQKQVVDFSLMSDRELLHFFQKPSTGSVCGRFMNDQLDRKLELPKKKFPWYSYALQILVPALFVTKLSAQRTMGKPAARPVQDTIRIPADPRPLMMGMVIRVPDKKPKVDSAIKNIFMIQEGLIKGKVTDQKGQPVPYASIDPGNGKARAADENGDFLLDATFLKNGQSVRISSVNFETKTIFIDKEKCFRDGLQVQLEGQADLPEAILVTYYHVKRCDITMGSVSTLKSTTEELDIIQAPEKKSGLQVYPNPVVSGSSLHLSFNQLREGYYQLTIFTYSGQLIQQKNLWIDSAAKVLSLELPVMTQGNYLLVMTNKETGEKLTAKFVVQ